MGKREEEVENIIRNTVFAKYFPLGTQDANKRGRDVLYKLYLKDYRFLNTIYTRRLILYNLIYVERQLKNEEAVAKYTIQLKEDMDGTPNYKNEFTQDYCNMLSYYLDCKYIKLDKDELIECYNFCYDYFKNLYNINKSDDTYLRMINMKFNICKIQKNFREVLKVIEDVHNIGHQQTNAYLEQMLCDVKEIDEELYNNAIDTINKYNIIDNCV